MKGSVNMFGDKSTFGYAKIVKTCPKKVNKKNTFFVHTFNKGQLPIF